MVVPKGNDAAAAPASNATAPVDQGRRGIVYGEQWPFLLDIDVEYQDWILVGVSFWIVALWCLPCLCGRLKNRCSRAFTSWAYTRLHNFFMLISCMNCAFLMLTIGVCPDWTVNEYAQYFMMFVAWVLEHLAKTIVSFAIFFAFYMLFRFRDRIALAAGMEHATFFRFSFKDLVGLQSKMRPVEIFFWKVEDLHSSSGKVLKANDIYIECHYGYNEPMRTRVHNNAGTACFIRESFQLNLDESTAASTMTLFVKDQSLVISTELAKLMLSTRELCGIEDQTGKRRTEFTYSEDSFVALDLIPRGKIWIAIAPVEELDEESRPLMNEDALVTC